MNASIPQHLYGFVDKRFLHGMDESYAGQYEPCVIFGITSIPSRAWTFSILCESGAQWARVPLHMLRWELPSLEAHPLNQLQMWDCHGYDFDVTQYQYLREMACEYRDRDGTQMPGSYWFTADHTDNGYSLYPPEHKCYHFLLLEDGSGQIAAMPNNRIVWKDDSWTKPGHPLDYKVVSPETYHAETSKTNAQRTAFTQDV